MRGAGWREGFEDGFAPGVGVGGVRGWTGAGQVIITEEVCHAGRHSLWLKEGARARRALEAAPQGLWIDAYLRGGTLFVKDRADRPVVQSSTERGFYSASEILPYRRIPSEVPIDDARWRRVTYHVDAANGRCDFYLDGRCVLRELLCLDGASPASAAHLEFLGPGYVDDVSVSNEAPDGLAEAPVWYPPRPGDCLLRVAHISDTHLKEVALQDGKTARLYYAESQRMARDLALVAPDLVIHTGDVCDGGSIRGLELAKEVFAAPGVPVYYVRGNHDLAGEAAEAFEKILGPKEQVVEHKGVRFILTDNATDAPAKSPLDHMGVYSDEQVAWIRKQLEASNGRPTILAGHVPLLKTAKPLYVARNQDAVLALMEQHKVLGFMAGHLHRSMLSSVQDGFIQGIALPVSGAYVPPTMKCLGFAIWDVLPGGVACYETPFYFPFRPAEGWRVERG